MAGCHNSPRGAFLLLLSLLPVPPPSPPPSPSPSPPPPPLRRRSCYACIGGQFLKVEISSSHCINDERSQPASQAVEAARRALYGLPPRAAAYVRHPCSMVWAWERVRTRRYRRHAPPPQGHSRYDEDHSRKEWKVFCIYVILYFMPLMEKHVPLILCRNSQFQQILNMYGFWCLKLPGIEPHLNRANILSGYEIGINIYSYLPA